MFVIALSLTLWAALTLGDGRRIEDEEPTSVAYVPFGGERPVWRREENEPGVVGFERRASEQPVRRTGLPPLPERAPVVAPRPEREERTDAGKKADARSNESLHGGAKNDDFRGARATVTQRPNHDDAFERFLDNDRD